MPNFFSGMPTFGNVAYIPHDVSYVQYILQRVLNLLSPEWQMDMVTLSTMFWAACSCF